MRTSASPAARASSNMPSPPLSDSGASPEVERVLPLLQRARASNRTLRRAVTLLEESAFRSVPPRYRSPGSLPFSFAACGQRCASERRSKRPTDDAVNPTHFADAKRVELGFVRYERLRTRRADTVLLSLAHVPRRAQPRHPEHGLQHLVVACAQHELVGRVRVRLERRVHRDAPRRASRVCAGIRGQLQCPARRRVARERSLKRVREDRRWRRGAQVLPAHGWAEHQIRRHSASWE
ncbi:hypothetical protein DFH11DRAFT_233778 [Phellopilus nigrolimitatus]|nr:hypothetical protein DFH11DRAFT_233778 [Phellopilus nigrolimitatus]